MANPNPSPKPNPQPNPQPHLGHGAQLRGLTRDVLEEHTGAGLARAAHDRDEALARVPEDARVLGVVAEGFGREAGGGGVRDARAAERAADLADGGMQRLLALAWLGLGLG